LDLIDWEFFPHIIRDDDMARAKLGLDPARTTVVPLVESADGVVLI
jgi:hypothetical protein